jgi:hypothetical protein
MLKSKRSAELLLHSSDVKGAAHIENLGVRIRESMMAVVGSIASSVFSSGANLCTYGRSSSSTGITAAKRNRPQKVAIKLWPSASEPIGAALIAFKTRSRVGAQRCDANTCGDRAE